MGRSYRRSFSHQKSMKPLFIVIEGLDGSGGTTQSRLLASWLEKCGDRVLLTQEPSNRRIGLLIQEALLPSTNETTIGDRVFPYLFAADRQDHLDEEILPTLSSGSHVVSDRYYHSSLAYQGISVGIAKVATLNESFPPPDFTFLLWLEPEISFSRVQGRGIPVERFETLDRLRAVAESYESVFTHCRAKGENIFKIDARRSIEEIHQDIVNHIKEHLRRQEAPKT